jgi:transposase-like protein
MKKDAVLNPKQIRILSDYFSRSLAGESMEEIAKSHGIGRKTLYYWKETHEGKRLYAEWKKEATRDAIPQYFDVLKEKALSGSYKHMELFAKVFGILSPEKQEIVHKNEGGSDNAISQEMLEDIKQRLAQSKELKRVK